MPHKLLLKDEEIGKATGHYFSSSQYRILEIVHKSNKAQLKKVGEEVERLMGIYSRTADDGCVWLPIDEFRQALLNEVK